MKKSNLLQSTLAALSALTLGGVAQAQDIYAMADSLNAELAAAGKNYRVAMAETITDLDSNEAGQTIIFRDLGNRQLAFDFVPGDTRRAWRAPGTGISFAVDNVNLTADLPGATELDQIRAAMATWENVNCSTLPLVDFGNTGVDLGVVQRQLGFGGIPAVAADLQHVGFLPANFFLQLGSSNILAVTFTFRFIDGAGNSTDIDNNGSFDAAFREIYYNDGFTWEDDANDVPGDGRFDLQTVSLHEVGHGLSQAHFGTGRIHAQTGRIQLSPQAVMNAGYIYGQRSLLGTDNGGHCSNWASWPNN